MNGQAAEVTGSLDLSCPTNDGNATVQLDQPLTFETCDEAGNRIAGTFTLNLTPISGPIPGLELTLPDVVTTSEFGQQIRQFRVVGNLESMPAGTSADSAWTLAYKFTADDSQAGRRPIVEPNAVPKTMLHLRISRHSTPQITWQVSPSSSVNGLTPGAEVATIEFNGKNLTAPAHVFLALAGDDQGMLGLDERGHALDFELTPDAPTHLVYVASGKNDVAHAEAKLSVQADAPGSCGPLLTSTEYDFDVNFHQKVTVLPPWGTIDGQTGGLTAEVKLSCPDADAGAKLEFDRPLNLASRGE